MKDMKQIIANNIISLRKAQNMTQAELASKLNYTDKAVSKWERAESVPDVTVIKEIADVFSVTVDYLMSEEHDEEKPEPAIISKHRNRNRVIITLLSVTLVFFIATIVFVIRGLLSFKITQSIWMCYIYAVPVACVVLLVFNSIWGKRIFNFVIISLLLWSILTALYLSFLPKHIWLIFIIGIPAQVIILLWSNLKLKFK
jgi:transcriptional regulator with XRE-family HTH domain